MSDSLELKLEEIRTNVAKKMNKWARPQWGYTPAPEPTRTEGECWIDENGKEWTMKDGIKRSTSKMEQFRTPLFCPRCTHIMNHRFDLKCYRRNEMCYDCTIKWHTKMMHEGTWEAYERKTLRDSERSFLRDKIQECKDYIRTFKIPQIHFEDGRWETIATLSHFKELFEEIKQYITLCETRITELNEEEAREINSSTENTLPETIGVVNT